MSSQAHLSVVTAAYPWDIARPAPKPPPSPKPRKPRNTNKGRKFPPDPIRPEEFALLLANCVPLREGRESQLSALSLQGQLGHARLDVTERYLRGIDPMERLAPTGARPAPRIQIPSIGERSS